MKAKFKILAAFLLTFALVLSVALIGAAEDPSETKLANEYYNSFTSDKADLGSLAYGNNFEKIEKISVVELYDGSKFQRIQGSGTARDKSVTYSPTLTTGYTYADKTADYVIFEFDIATEGKFPNDLYFQMKSNNSGGGDYFYIIQNGNTLTITTSKKVFNESTTMVTIDCSPHQWNHITMVAEITDKTNPVSTSTPIHFFANGVYTNTYTGKWPLGYTGEHTLYGVRFFQGSTSKIMNTDETLLLDSVSMSLYTKNSDGEGSLAYVLADKENRNLSEWTAGSWTEDYAFPPSGVACAIGETPYGSFGEAYDAVKDGEVIEIYRDVTEPFEITKPVKVDTNGYTFNYSSDNLILKEVNGNEFTFGEGEITVTFYDENGNELGSEIYTGAKLVTVPQEVLDKVQYLSKVTGENGSASIKITDGWKKSRAEGAPSFKNEELGYATPTNCNFYLNSYVITSDFVVIDENKKLTEYTDGNLAAAVNAITTDSATVILNSDITLPSSVIITKDITLDFNTYGITYDGIHTMFIVRDGSLDLEGPGSINKSSKSSFVFDVEQGSEADVKINGVNILSSTIVANVQSGSLTVENSTIKVEGGDEVDAIVVQNADVAITDSKIELEASGNESYTIKAEGSSVTISGSTLTSNAGGLATDENSSVSLEDGTAVKAETAFGGETSNVTLTEGVQISTDKGAEDISLPDGLVFAYTEDLDMPYIITSDYVVVTWKIGDFEAQENWVKGTKPAYKDADVAETLKEYQSSNTDKTKMYAFSVEKVYEDTTFTPQLVDIIAPMYNVTLGNDLTMTIYIPTEQFGATTVSVTLGEDTLDVSKLAKTTIGIYEYYVVTVEGILPSKAVENIEFKVGFAYEDDDNSYELSFKTSVVKYCDAILSLSAGYDAEVVTALKAMLNYVDKSYKYVGADNNSAYAELVAVMTKHNISFEALDYTDRESETDLVINEDDEDNRYGADGRFTDVHFIYDEGGARYEFVIAEGFSGRVKIMQGDEVVVYNVTHGKLDGSNTIVYTPDIDSFFEVITVKYNDNRTIFVYDILSFLANEENDAKTQAFADAFVIYCTSVSELPVID